MPALAFTLPQSLSLEELRTWLIVAGAAFLLLAFAAMRFVQKMAVRGTLAVICVALGLLCYVERSQLADCARTCDCNVLSLEVNIPRCEPVR